MTKLTVNDSPIDTSTLKAMSESDIASRIEYAGKATDWHYQHAVAWSIVQGALIAHAKKHVVHGSFQKWLGEHAPACSYQTSNRNRKLAEAIRDAIKNDTRVTFAWEDLINLPLLADEKREQVLGYLERVEEITEGRSLRQLYHDFEICKLPDRRGGKRTVASVEEDEGEEDAEPTPEELRAAALAEWKGAAKRIEEQLKRANHTLLPADIKETISGILLDAAYAVDPRLSPIA